MLLPVQWAVKKVQAIPALLFLAAASVNAVKYISIVNWVHVDSPENELEDL